MSRSDRIKSNLTALSAQNQDSPDLRYIRMQPADQSPMPSLFRRSFHGFPPRPSFSGRFTAGAFSHRTAVPLSRPSRASQSNLPVSGNFSSSLCPYSPPRVPIVVCIVSRRHLRLSHVLLLRIYRTSNFASRHQRPSYDGRARGHSPRLPYATPVLHMPRARIILVARPYSTS